MIARLFWSLLFTALLLLCGCARQWNPAWQPVTPSPPASITQQRIDTANQLFATADSAERLQQTISAYRAVLETDRTNYTALQQLSSLSILRGTAYTNSRQEKAQLFQQAMRYAEWAMYTNPQFRRQVDSGATPWQAVTQLTANEAEAMLFWATAVQYQFKEGWTLYGKIINIAWLKHAQIMLDRVAEVAPTFGGGAVEFGQAICYYALPTRMGGDKQQGDAAMQRAMAHGSDWLLPRWALGKYYHPIRDEQELAQQQLTWVAKQKLDQFADPYPWRVHFQDDARQLLQD